MQGSLARNITSDQFSGYFDKKYALESKQSLIIFALRYLIFDQR
jgi:hypothetical protein